MSYQSSKVVTVAIGKTCSYTNFIFPFAAWNKKSEEDANIADIANKIFVYV